MIIVITSHEDMDITTGPLPWERSKKNQNWSQQGQPTDEVRPLLPHWACFLIELSVSQKQVSSLLVQD